MFSGSCSTTLMILPTIIGNLKKVFVSHRTLGYLLKLVQGGVKLRPFFAFGKFPKVVDKVLRKTMIKKSYHLENSFFLDAASANHSHTESLTFP